MKQFKIILALVFLTGLSLAQDSVFVTINNDTIDIWNTGAFENCAFSVVFETTIANDTITIVEHDTMTNPVYCMCYFDLCASLTGLNPGNYHVDVFRKYEILYTPDSLYYIGSTDFTYNGTAAPLNEIYLQSECYNPQSITNQDFLPDNYLTIDNYPNPFNSKTTIRYSVPHPSFVNITVYDVLGKEIVTLVNNNQGKGTYVTYFDGSVFSSGIYFCKLRVSRNLSKTIKLILMK